MTPTDAETSQGVIRSFQTKLASAGTLPERSLRRNSGEYPLVCCINNVTALFVGENWKAAPIFVARAAEHMIAATCRQPIEVLLRTCRTVPWPDRAPPDRRSG
jgi:hypothetical protein